MTAPQFPPYQGVPYTAPPKKSKLGLILGIVGGVLVLCCGGGIALALTVDTGKQSKPSKPAAAASSQAAPARKAAYKQPADPCALADLTVLGPRVGEGKGEPSEEKTKFTLTGCEYFLAAGDGAQEVKAFANADGDTAARYQESAGIYPKISGFDDQKVSGCGSQAFFTKRLSYGDKRVEAILVCTDQNLYVEVRFNAGGNQAWDAAALQQNMVKLVNGMIAKVPQA
jgi:hypothetical protein